MKNYRIVYVTVKRNGLWVEKGEKYIKAENFNQIVLELTKTITSKFYLLEIWEEIPEDYYGAYRLISSNETSEIKPLDRVLKSYVQEIEKTIGNGETIFLDKLYTKKLKTILQEMVDRFCEK